MQGSASRSYATCAGTGASDFDFHLAPDFSSLWMLFKKVPSQQQQTFGRMVHFDRWRGAFDGRLAYGPDPIITLKEPDMSNAEMQREPAVTASVDRR